MSHSFVKDKTKRVAHRCDAYDRFSARRMGNAHSGAGPKNALRSNSILKVPKAPLVEVAPQGH